MSLTPPAFWSAIDPANLPPHLQGAAVAIGNFDGVHRGHKAVLAAAKSAGRPALALTFEPHPRSFFRPDIPVRKITGLGEKFAIFAHEGLDGAIVMTFDAALADQSAEAFIAEVLAERLKIAHVAVGYNFHFGKGREGSPDFLSQIAPRYGIGVTIVSPEGDGDAISSTAIRALLMAGAISEANRLLGHCWFVSGIVQHGEKRGRDLGFPTANLALPPETPLKYGIYAVRARCEGRLYEGVASFGRRPTFDNGAPLLETYLFDFSGNLYGKELHVEFAGFIRSEIKFDTLSDLVESMRSDTLMSKAILKKSHDASVSIIYP